MNFNKKKQRWSLRKLSVGLASIMLGVTFVSTSQVAKAETVEGQNIKAKAISENKEESSFNNSDTESLSDTSQDKGILKKVEEKSSSLKDKVEEKESNFEKNSDKVTNKVEDYAGKIKSGSETINSSIKKYGKDITENSDNITLISKNKTDKKKDKELHTVTQEEINKKIFEKYNNLVNSVDKDAWKEGLPDDEQASIKTKSGTTIEVKRPQDGPYPMENNIIKTTSKEYTYVPDSGKSSVFGYGVNNFGYNLLPTYSFWDRIWGEPEVDYNWISKDGNIIIKRSSSFTQDYKTGGVKQNIEKDKNQNVDVKEEESEEKESNSISYTVKLGINEYAILTPEGNLIHKVTFTNTGDDPKVANTPLKFYVLVDTSLNGKDGMPIYSTGHDGLYITDKDMVYAVRSLGDSELYATDYSKAEKYAANISNSQSRANSDEDKIQLKTNDTSMRIMAPTKTLKPGQSTDLWYEEVAYQLNKKGMQSLGQQVSDQLNSAVSDWLKKIDDINKKVQDVKSNTDKVLKPVDDTLNNVLNPIDDTEKELKDTANKKKKDIEDGVKNKIHDEIDKDDTLKEIGKVKVDGDKSLEDTAIDKGTEKVKEEGKNLFNKVKESNAVQQVKNSKVGQFVTKGVGKIVSVFKTLGNAKELAESVRSGVEKIRSTVRKTTSAISDALSSIRSSLVTLKSVLFGKKVVLDKKHSKKLAKDVSKTLAIKYISKGIEKEKNKLNQEIDKGRKILSTAIKTESETLKSKLNTSLTSLGSTGLQAAISGLMPGGIILNSIFSVGTDWIAKHAASTITDLIWDGKTILTGIPLMNNTNIGIPNYQGVDGLVFKKVQSEFKSQVEDIKFGLNSMIADVDKKLKKGASKGIDMVISKI